MKKKSPLPVYETNERVFAKVKGFPHWPACVTCPNDAKGIRYKVFFYGTYETALVKTEDMQRYNDTTKEKFGKQKRKGFADAMDEIENRPEVGYLTLQEIPEGQVMLEGGTSGDTILEESSLDSSSVDESKTEAKPEETPVEAKSPTPPPAELVKPAATKKGTKRKATAAVESPATPAAKQAKKEAPKTPKTPATPASDPAPAAAKQAKKEAPKTPKTPKTPATPASDPAPAATSTPAAPSTPGGEEKTSRSGRVIKPKKFEDENDTPKVTTVQRRTSTNNLKVEDGVSNAKAFAPKRNDRKMWVVSKATGDTIEINMDKERPGSFESPEEEVEWDRLSAKNALRFKKLIESGQYIPAEILSRIEEKINRTPEDDAVIRQFLKMSNIREKMRWMKVEKRLIDIDIAIRMALHHQEPDMERCLSLIEEFKKLAIQPLMLKKLPDVVSTVRKIRKYIGPKNPHADPKVNELWKEQMEKIRVNAEELYCIIKKLFSPPEDGTNFGIYFQNIIDDFRNSTKDMPKEDVLQLVIDPTSN